MTFDDLPDDWADRPLTDPSLVADVLDLVVLDRDRRAGGLTVLLCDDDGRLVQPVSVSHLPDRPDDAERVQALATILSAMGGQGGVLLALARGDGLSIRAGDRSWRRAAERVCRDQEVRLLGLHVVTCTGSREVPGDPAAA